MPAYSFYCDDCGYPFVATYRFTDDSSTSPCPQCEKPARKVFHANAISFKGHGWGGSKK